MSWMLYAALKRRSSTSRRSSFWKRNVKVPTLAAKSAARMGHPFVWLMARSGAWASCRGNAKGTMVEGAGTEEPEILRGDRQGLKPECELMLYAALKRRSSTFMRLFHVRADLPSPRRYTGELLEAFGVRITGRDPSTAQAGSLRSPACFARDDKAKSRASPHGSRENSLRRSGRGRGGAGSFDCGWSLRTSRKDQSSLRMTRK